MSGCKYLRIPLEFVRQLLRYAIHKAENVCNTNYWLTQQIRQLSFAIIHSTTIALHAWRHTCSELNLKKRLIPRDIVTRWNSPYDMLHFVPAYWKAIDQITADKALKLRRYELDSDDWIIIKDLVSILEV